MVYRFTEDSHCSTHDSALQTKLGSRLLAPPKFAPLLNNSWEPMELLLLSRILNEWGSVEDLGSSPGAQWQGQESPLHFDRLPPSITGPWRHGGGAASRSALEVGDG